MANALDGQENEKENGEAYYCHKNNGNLAEFLKGNMPMLEREICPDARKGTLYNSRLTLVKSGSELRYRK